MGFNTVFKGLISVLPVPTESISIITSLVTLKQQFVGSYRLWLRYWYEGGPKNNWKLNVARELEVVARCAARCRKSIQYSSSPPRGVNL